MTKQTFHLINDSIRSRVIDAVKRAPEGMDVIIQKHTDNRSAAQQGLQWLWYTFIAGETGETKEEVHERYKERFLVPIYERDDTQYAEMIESVRSVHRGGMKKEAAAMKNEIVKLTSTTKANVQQMGEYLTEIERDNMGNGIYLPRPEDRYRDAMGG